MIDFKPIPDTDLEVYHQMLNDKSFAVNAGSVPHPVTQEWAQERLQSRREMEVNGEGADRGLYDGSVLVGTFGYFYRDHGLEIGYGIHKDHRGRGLATKAARLAVKLARDHRRTGPIAANYFQDNPASGRVLEKTGFKKIGEDVGTSKGREGDIPSFNTLLEGDVCLSSLHDTDFDTLFEFQNDLEAFKLAGAGSPKESVEAFRAFIRAGEDKGAMFRAILREGVPVGYIAQFTRGTETEISYWIGRAYWNSGYASTALSLWLAEMPLPEGGLYARVVDGNAASERVLEKSGFSVIGTDRFYSDIRQANVKEKIFRLTLS